MNKQTIIALLLVFYALTAQAVDERHFHRGDAVLKGRIQNKPKDEWNALSVQINNLFTDEEQIFSIPVAADGTFESVIPLPHSQGVLVMDVANVFLSIGDTVEVTKDALLEDDDVAFGGNSFSTTINKLWPSLKKQYFGEEKLFIYHLQKEKIPAWKEKMVSYIDRIIADIEAERLPVPVGTSDFAKEVLGASLLAEPFLAIMDNYRYNMTPEGTLYITNFSDAKLDEYYDFLAAREKWLLDNPAMLLIVDHSDILINRVEFYMMMDIAFMRYGKTTEFKRNDHAGYYQLAAQNIKSRYNLKEIGFLEQIVLCHDVFEEGHLEEDFSPDEFSSFFAAIIPLITSPIVAHQALERYRQYVISREGKLPETATATPEADAVFQRIIEPYKGNALYVDFWGMGCGPCRAGMLEEREKVEQMKDQPVRFLYICDEKVSPRDQSERWMKENNIKGEHIYVTHEEWKLLSAKFQFSAIPFQTAFDKDGNVVTRQYLDKYFYEVMKSE